MANEIWTIKRCLEWTKEYLAERGEEHPRLSAEWLLCAATGLTRIDLYMRMDETLNAAQLETMHAAVVRRAKGEPLQYITGSTQFRMIDVACAPGVLIPRPETEMLVEEVLNYLDAEVLSPEAAARQRVELPWNDEVEQARKAEAALADERATAERRAANLTAADEAALGGDVLGSRAYAEELADREAEEAAAQTAEAEAAEAEATEVPEPELDEYGIAIEGADHEAISDGGCRRARSSRAPHCPRSRGRLRHGLHLAFPCLGASRPCRLHRYRYRAARHRPGHQKPRRARAYVR